ncbi:unnamed protein product [Ectocarpus fasciculatus]
MNGPWFDHVLEWWEAANADPEHILFLHYEAMLAEPLEHIRKIADFAGIKYTADILAKVYMLVLSALLPCLRIKHALPPTDRSIDQVDAASSLSAMKRNPKTNLYPSKKHLRKGGAGGWRDSFTVRESEAFDEIYREQMEGSGLRMDFGEGLVM